MKKLFLLPLLLSAANLPMVSAQHTSQPSVTIQPKATSNKESIKIPAEIRLILRVEEMPGMENPKSFWEGVYEIRVADWHTIVEKTKSGSGDVEVA